MTIQLITDGGSDLSSQMRKDWNVKVIPLYIHLDNEQIKSEDVSVADFAKKSEPKPIVSNNICSWPI